ncbi:PTS sugar transporter subunit IIA [Clostridiales bacterium COT073_COT-073]|nr:PTS sugar transporter subunit IIA [Clostridiales bacterium COT073_COT-073]
MDGFELTTQLVRMEKSAKNWEEAIRISTQDLLNGGYIKESYVDGIIDCVKEFGPYIVIAPDIALPHARPEKGAIKIGYSITRFEEPVLFEEDGSVDAKLFISLSCVHDDTHILMLQEIVEILSDDAKKEVLFTARDKEEIVKVFTNK